MVILKLSIRVIELASRALHIPRPIVVDRVIPKVAKIFPPSRSTVNDHIVREINARGITNAADVVDRIRYGPEGTCDAVFDVCLRVSEIRDTLAAEIATVHSA